MRVPGRQRVRLRGVGREIGRVERDGAVCRRDTNNGDDFVHPHHLWGAGNIGIPSHRAPAGGGARRTKTSTS
jgi:hypothetical protein